MIVMSADEKAIRLLILEDSQPAAERIVSLFCSSGYAAQAYRVSSLASLTAALKSSWDLCIAAQLSENLNIFTALQTIKCATADIACIQLLKNNPSIALTERLACRADNAVYQGEDERFILIAKRELAHLEERRRRCALEAALNDIQKRYQLLLDSSAEAIAYIDNDRHIEVNNAYLQLFGYTDLEEIKTKPLLDLIANNDQTLVQQHLHNCLSNNSHSKLICTGVSASVATFQAKVDFCAIPYNHTICVQVLFRPTNNHLEPKQQTQQNNQQYLVNGLHNRQQFLECLDTAAERAINIAQPLSVAYIKIDHYPQLQAELGIAGIDLFLAALMTVLRSELSTGSQIGRFTDDAFSVFTPNITPQQYKANLLNLIKQTEAQLFEVNHRSVQTTLTIGVAVINEKSAQAATVLKRARDCADQLKQGNGLKIHNPADDLAAAAKCGNRVAMLQQALTNNSFKVLFQPIISLHGTQAQLYEVLVRLQNPQGVDISTADFLPVAISAGLAEKIDRWIILSATKQLAEQHRQNKHTRLFIPLSSASLQDPSFLAWLKTTLHTLHLPAQSLIFQLEESTAIIYLKQAKQLSLGLQQLQCLLALEHFGCTLNPLHTLKHLNLNFVKLDRSLTDDLTLLDQQQALKETLSTLHAQDTQSVVSGIASAKVLPTLWHLGANYIQGDYLQNPSPSMSYDFSTTHE